MYVQPVLTKVLRVLRSRLVFYGHEVKTLGRPLPTSSRYAVMFFCVMSSLTHVPMQCCHPAVDDFRLPRKPPTFVPDVSPVHRHALAMPAGFSCVAASLSRSTSWSAPMRWTDWLSTGSLLRCCTDRLTKETKSAGHVRRRKL